MTLVIAGALCLLGYRAAAQSDVSSSGEEYSVQEVSQEELTQSGDRRAANSGILFLGKLHLVLLHFPIALIVLILFWATLEHLGWLGLSDSFWRWTLGFSAASAALTAAVGLARAEQYWERADGDLVALLVRHQWMGLISAALMVGLWPCWRWTTARQKGRWFRLYVLLTSLAMTLAGFLGGEISFGQGYWK